MDWTTGIRLRRNLHGPTRSPQFACKNAENDDTSLTFIAVTCRKKSIEMLDLTPYPPPFAQAITCMQVGPDKVRGTSLAVESGHRQSWELTHARMA